MESNGRFTAFCPKVADNDVIKTVNVVDTGRAFPDANVIHAGKAPLVRPPNPGPG